MLHVPNSFSGGVKTLNLIITDNPILLLVLVTDTFLYTSSAVSSTVVL